MYTREKSREARTLEVENVFKIAATYSRVREFLADEGWKFQGEDEEMDLFKYKKTGRLLYAEDISENFPVTFLMGGLSMSEFGSMARKLVPEIDLLEVDSSWEGRATTIVVAMTEEQVRDMFGKRAKMRPLGLHSATP